MFTFLYQPFPSYENTKRQFFFCILIGLLVGGILLSLEPFNMQFFSTNQKIVIAFAFGCISFCISAFYMVLIPYLLPNLFSQNRWTVLKEIILVVILITTIAMVNLLFDCWERNISFMNILKMMSITLTIGILPVSTIVSLKQKILQNTYKKEAESLRNLLKSTPILTNTVEDIKPLSQQITLIGANSKEVLEISVNQLLYIKAEDNYINIAYSEESKIIFLLFRNSLKNIEENLHDFKEISRCHRSYLINMQKIEKVIGDAQGIKIKLENVDEYIPVSRKYKDLLKLKINTAKYLI